MSSKKVFGRGHWEWEDDKKKWQPFNTETNNLIEDAFQTPDVLKVALNQGFFGRSAGGYFIDFVHFEQVRCLSMFRRPVRRVPQANPKTTDKLEKIAGYVCKKGKWTVSLKFIRVAKTLDHRPAILISDRPNDPEFKFIPFEEVLAIESKKDSTFSIRTNHETLLFSPPKDRGRQSTLSYWVDGLNEWHKLTKKPLDRKNLSNDNNNNSQTPPLKKVTDDISGYLDMRVGIFSSERMFFVKRGTKLYYAQSPTSPRIRAINTEYIAPKDIVLSSHGFTLATRENTLKLTIPKSTSSTPQQWRDAILPKKATPPPSPAPKRGIFQDYYELDRVIGQSNFVVRLAFEKRTKKEFAVKIANLENIQEDEYEELQREITIMKRLEHDNIVKFYESFETKAHMYMVIEYMPGGELFDCVLEEGFLGEPEISSILRQVLVAMHYCHKNKVAHRDLKPQNLLTTSKKPPYTIKVSDFGASNFFNIRQLQTLVGTPEYTAPEVILNDSYDEKVDIWACGVIAYVLLSGLLPFGTEGELFEQQNQKELMDQICFGKVNFPNEEWGDISEEAKEFATALLTKDPTLRPSAESALQLEFISQETESQPVSLRSSQTSNLTPFNRKSFANILSSTKKARSRSSPETFFGFEKNFEENLENNNDDE